METKRSSLQATAVSDRQSGTDSAEAQTEKNQTTRSEATETAVKPTAAPSQEASPSNGRRGINAILIIFGLVAVAGAMALALMLHRSSTSTVDQTKASAESETTNAAPGEANVVTLTESQAAGITFETATERSFRAERLATGKIAFNEDAVTPVFSPYAGRITRLPVKPGDTIQQGSALFEIDTPDLVQAESDLIAATISVSRANSLVDLARRTEDRQHKLYVNKAVALKDWEQAESDLKSAERDGHSAQTALEAARQRLSTFGKSREEIQKIETDRQIDRLTRVLSPIAGTIVARKVGLGQYVKPDSADPLFTIANLSTTWLLADVYESDLPFIKVGQPVEVRVAAYPDETFRARISYIGAAVDPTTRRMPVRSVIENRGRRLKPEMFASFRLVTSAPLVSLAVPSRAVLREADRTSVWVAESGRRFVRRDVKLGVEQDSYSQILSGLSAGDRVVSDGALFLNSASAE